VVPRAAAATAERRLRAEGVSTWVIGEIRRGPRRVTYTGS